MHTDIRQDNFILNTIPAQWRPYALLMRLDRPIGTWLLFWPGAWAIAAAHGPLDGYNFFLILLFALGALLMRSAGCIINDIWDRELDKQVERTRARPLASGELRLWQAAMLLGILLFLALVILVQMNGQAIQLGFLAIALVVAYPLMKRITWWPQAFLGLTFNWGALLGTAAVTGHITLTGLLLYMAGILWTLGYDTIYAAQDVEDDALAGIKSTARLFGKNMIYWVTGFYIGVILLLFAIGVLAHAAPLYYAFFGFAGLHLAWQIGRWDSANPLSSLDIFKSNKFTGAFIFMALLFI
ncbi:MAG: 4-hydroxybenzoate octaprenyltransferase [Alphaproteobacteria bacterium]|nr:4-hydroxybenzoate octaprenyltransferase [Alphaproteobacteria bacterium]